MKLPLRIRNEIQTLFPAYFALVMATGITSIASHLLNFEQIGNLLFWINVFQYAILLVLFLLRIFFFFPKVVEDLSSHVKGVGFLTLVAGSCILGTQCALLKQSYAPAQVLWAFSFATWLLLMYSFLLRVMVKAQKPSLEGGMDGAWLLLVVSTQSVSVLGSTLAPHPFMPQDVMLFISIFMFLLGLALYFYIIPIVFYRLVFFPVLPEEVTPSYWINMGAAAITTLAGVTLLQNFSGQPALVDFYGFIKAAALLFWAVASFWIPVVLLLEIWRYGYKKSPIKYQPSYWSLVFPLGMYTVCTWQLAAALTFPFLKSIAGVFIYVVWAAWLITFVGMCSRMFNFFKTPYPQNEVKLKAS